MKVKFNPRSTVDVPYINTLRKNLNLNLDFYQAFKLHGGYTYKHGNKEKLSHCRYQNATLSFTKLSLEPT